jgi:hypothetical protein
MSHTPLNKRFLQQDSRYTNGRPVWMMTAGTFPLPAVAHCDINDGPTVGYQAMFTTDYYGNTATGLVSGMTVVDVGTNAQLRALIDVNSQFGNTQYNLLSPITITYSDATTQTFSEVRSTNITSGSVIEFGYNATTVGHNFPIIATTANYSASQVDRNCELRKQINTRQYRVQPYGLNLLTNGSFTAPTGTSTGWTTVSGSPTLVSGAASAPTSYSYNNSGNNYLAVTNGSDIVLSQSLTTVVGDSYRVEGAGYGLTGGAGNPYDSRVKVEIGASTLYNNYVSLDYYPAFYGPYVFKATSTTTVFKLTVHAVGQSIRVGHFSVRQLLPTRVAKLTAGVSTQTNQVDLTATDVNGNEYWVTKLQAHLCTVVPKNPSSGNLVYTSGKRAPWRESPASGIYLDLNTTFSY